MNNILTLSLSLIALALSTATVTLGQQPTHQHTDHLAVLIEDYLAAKNALANDNFETAKKHISSLVEEVLNSEEMNNHKAHNEKHAKHHSQMVLAIRNAEQSENIAELRSAFLSISENLIKAVRNQNYDDKELFLQYCPMVDNSSGGYWLSSSEKIENPYYGSMMKSCGTLKNLN